MKLLIYKPVFFWGVDEKATVIWLEPLWIFGMSVADSGIACNEPPVKTKLGSGIRTLHQLC